MVIGHSWWWKWPIPKQFVDFLHRAYRGVIANEVFCSVRNAMKGLTKDRVQTLRLSVLMFLESVIILDAAIAQVAAERLDDQPVLFHDCSVELEEQLQMVEDLSEHFNSLARAVDVAEIGGYPLR
jgi:3'-phosphoadenosine 5'-phosphosulfate sulfotransferase (PAPS reductase)/FAD synthetase